MLINWIKKFTTGLGTCLVLDFLIVPDPSEKRGFYLGVETMDLQPMYWFSFSGWKMYHKFKNRVFCFFKATWFILFWDTTVWWHVGNPAIKIQSWQTSTHSASHVYVPHFAVELNYNPTWFDHAVKVSETLQLWCSRDSIMYLTNNHFFT